MIHLIDPDEEQKGGCIWVFFEAMAISSMVVLGVLMAVKYVYGD